MLQQQYSRLGAAAKPRSQAARPHVATPSRSLIATPTYATAPATSSSAQSPSSTGSNGQTRSKVVEHNSSLKGMFNAKPSALIRFGFPKGSLQQSTHDLFHRAGFSIKISERGYFPEVDDEQLQLVLFRAQEIPRYVAAGVLDAGICGLDWIVETQADVVEVCTLQYSKSTSNPARWVLAVPEDSPVQSAKDLHGTIVASELVETTKRYFADRGVNVHVEYSWGATEVKASLPGVGAIVDITETGSSLRANKLRIVDTVLSSTTRLVANRQAWENPQKRQKIEDMMLLLQGAIDGRKKRGLKFNMERKALDQLSSMLPSEQSPTLSPLMEEGWVAVEVVVEDHLARRLIPAVKRLGGTGVFTYDVMTIVH